MNTDRCARLGAVVIGRNEGERLRRCLLSLKTQVSRIVYVDSGSTDGSPDLARALPCEVVSLDDAAPFTAARARNAGLRRLVEMNPAIEFVQFVDADCEVHRDWIATALRRIAENPVVAVVCGRRRERLPEKSVYNRLCDIEWNTPIGEAQSCGGDAMMRIAAIRAAGGFRDDLIAGEEPELCLRLRESGWIVRRIDAEMTTHDAAISSFRQWWRRAMRCGYAYAEGFSLHGGAPHHFRKREIRSVLWWGMLLPGASCTLAWPSYGCSLLALGTYAFLWLRIYGRQIRRGVPSGDANAYSALCIVGKWAQAAGAVRFWWGRARGQRSAIIEYKGPVRTAGVSET